jgi:kynurenine formamidase
VPKRIIDLSVPLHAGVASGPPGFGPQIEYLDHGAGARQLVASFPGLRLEDLPGQEGWAVELVRMSTHAGTHMDAPYHYRSTSEDGQPMATIDQIPLEWCIGPGVKLDFRRLPDGHVISPEELDAELARIGHTLSPGDIVLINTAAGARYGFDDYLERGCGVGRAGTLHLTRQGVRVVGTDAWSWDAPFYWTAQKWAKDHDPSIIWEGHKAGRDIGYCHLEKLHNLEALPGDGFTIACFPHKIRGASAGWTRAVAIFEE